MEMGLTLFIVSLGISRIAISSSCMSKAFMINQKLNNLTTRVIYVLP